MVRIRKWTLSWNRSTRPLLHHPLLLSITVCLFFSAQTQTHTHAQEPWSQAVTHTHTHSIDMKASPQLFWCRASWLMHRRNKMSALESIRLNSEGCRASHVHTQMHKRVVTEPGLQRKGKIRINGRDKSRKNMREIHISVSYFWPCPSFTHLPLLSGWGRNE